MKLNGASIQALNERVEPIVREGGDYIFTLKGGADPSEFNMLVPDVEPPVVTLPNGLTAQQLDDPKYKAKRSERNQLFFAWLVIKALSHTQGLVWETVKLDDPSTWSKWGEELINSGLTQKEINRLTEAAMYVYNLDEAKVEAARNRFFATRLQEAKA